jgi:hypothetical protein
MWPKRKQGQRKAWCISSPKNLTQWPWPWKSIGFQTHLRTKYVPRSVKIYWRMLHGKQIWPGNLDLWPWKSTGFQILLKTKHVPSLTKIHWRMLILVFTRQKLDPVSLTFDLWPWKSIEFQSLRRTTYIPSLVKIHWKMLILVFTR